MRKLKELSDKIKRFIQKYLFLIKSNNKQDFLIDKQLSLFFHYQELSKTINDYGDVRQSMFLSGESYEYLGNFSEYCDFKGIDHLERIDKYIEENKINYNNKL